MSALGCLFLGKGDLGKRYSVRRKENLYSDYWVKKIES